MPESADEIRARVAEDIRTRVGTTIQQIRHRRGLSQAALAELIDKSEKQIGEIEAGRANAGLETLAWIADALRVDIAELFTRPDTDSVEGGAYIPRESVDHLIALGERLQRTRAPRSKPSDR